MKRLIIVSIFVILFAITACGPKTQTPSPLPSVTLPAADPTNTSLPETTILPTEPPAAASNTPAPVAPAAPVDYSPAVYLDNRSTPATLLYSMANAINRHEFIRAYSYWSTPFDYIGLLEAFTNNYANTSNVQLNIGDILREDAVGMTFYSSPVIFTFTNLDTTVYRLSSCFLFRMPQPASFGEPPIDLLHILKGGLNPVPLDISDSDAMRSACNGTDYGTYAAGNPPESQNLENLAELSPDNYIDNRSGAVEVVSSLYNAINRKEYLRAFAYWQDPTAVGSFVDFAAGSADTDQITAAFGAVLSDAGAGQYYYQVPVTQTVKTISGTTQTYVGCYTLHLANPGMQAAMPFEPLGIINSKLALVANDLDTSALMERACN